MLPWLKKPASSIFSQRKDDENLQDGYGNNAREMVENAPLNHPKVFLIKPEIFLIFGDNFDLGRGQQERPY